MNSSPNFINFFILLSFNVIISSCPLLGSSGLSCVSIYGVLHFSHAGFISIAFKYSGSYFRMGSAQTVQSISSEFFGNEGSLPEEEFEVSAYVLVIIPLYVKLGCWYCSISGILASSSERAFSSFIFIFTELFPPIFYFNLKSFHFIRFSDWGDIQVIHFLPLIKKIPVSSLLL